MADSPIENVTARVRAEGARPAIDALLATFDDPPVPEAWISRPSAADLMDRAVAVDALVATGAVLPLAGVPFAVKDNIDVAGVPTTAACAEYAYVPERSAPVVETLLRAGAVYAGKTNLDQFATGLVGTRSPQFGPCRNPVVPAYIAGGSSSGSAIVVATGEVALALGTDTAGSGRVPAALCGVLGLKPTPGVVPTVGVVPAMASFDCVSAFTRCVADAATTFDVLGPAGRSPARVPTRIGVPIGVDWHGDHDAVAQFAAATHHLRALGFAVDEVDGSHLWAAGEMLYGSALVAERYTAFGGFAETHPDALDAAVAEIVRDAGRHTASDAFRALADVRALRAQAASLWGSVDALVLPTVARVPTFAEAMADRFGPSRELSRLTAFVNPLGFAAVAVPFGTRASGVPFGVSFVGPGGGDRALLALSAAFAGEALGPATALHGRACRIAVVGAHLSGQPLNHQLTELDAVLCGRTTTAPVYRLFALDTTPPKPGLVRAGDGRGAAVEVEVWGLDAEGLGRFVSAIPAPLGVGRVELADGTEVTGFLCEPHAVEHAREITEYGGWRAYLAADRTTPSP